MPNSEHKTNIDVQDGFLAQLRREGKMVFVYLLTGKRLTGTVKRFDRYCLVVESHGQEHLVFKHAVASICLARGEGEGGS
ncbi:MAG: RNA chaperone Hfq [Thermoanaerobaculum sp.]